MKAYLCLGTSKKIQVIMPRIANTGQNDTSKNYPEQMTR